MKLKITFNLNRLKEQLRNIFLKYQGHQRQIKKILLLALLILVFAAGIIGGYFYFWHYQKDKVFEKDIYANFTAEVYETVKNNYWEKISDDELSGLFRLGAEKITNLPQVLDLANKQGVEKMVLRITKDMPTDKKKDFTVKLVNIILTNLKPFGRSQLYSQKQETQLRNTVANIDTNVNLYQSLGVDKTASPEQIQKAYEEKVAKLSPEKDTSSPAAQELAQAERAYQTLSRPETRTVYDQSGAEITVFAKLVLPDILHLRLTKLSPQTFQEFQETSSRIDKTSNPTTMILDLRSNVGGDIDLLQYFLGPFIGENQYAYEFFHQGDYKPFKTQTGWLSSLIRYKKVVILVDNQTQSSAELMASVLKKYNVGILIGAQTKGWGTVENVFPIKQGLDVSEKYSVFLVHSLALGDDNQPIEGRGVAPIISIDNQNWQKELLAYFNYQPLITAIQTIINEDNK
jgi:hypothetical protein